MRILNRYLTRDFLITFAMTLAVFTFVMSIGAVIKAIDLIARGASGAVILKVFIFNMPFTMMFTIPMSVMTTVLLLFGKLSMDGEITAMRSCGISMWEITAPVIMLSIVLSLLCLYISNTLAPRCWYARRNILHKIGGENPAALLEEGRFIREIPGYLIYIGKKQKNTFKDIIIYEVDEAGKVLRNIRAREGDVAYNKDTGRMKLNLRGNVRIHQPGRMPPYIFAENHPLDFDMSDMLKRGQAHKKVSDLVFMELVRAIRDVEKNRKDITPEDAAKERMKLMVQANKRLGLSIACFAFTILGIPLGLKSHRRESTAGIGISLILVFVFYLFIILAETLENKPHYRPDLIIWIPIVSAEIIGFLLLRRVQ